MKHAKLLTTQNMVLIAMFTAILSILSPISFILPGGIPITLQTFTVALLAIILGPKLGSISVIIYILIGSVGFPVFANFKSGIGVLFGPTGGYLIGFVFMAFLVGLGKEKKFIISIIYSILGLLVCHALGLIVYGYITKTLLPTAPYLFAKDTVTVILALVLGRELSIIIKPIMRKGNEQSTL